MKRLFWLGLMLTGAALGAVEVLWENEFGSGKWKPYRGGPKNMPAKTVTLNGKPAVEVRDICTKSETGIVRTFPMKSSGFARITAEAEALPGKSMNGAYIQLRFFPSNKYRQVNLAAKRITAEIPEGTTSASVYLYTHFEEMPEFVIRSAKMEYSPTDFPAPPVDPKKMPGVLKNMKRELYIDTCLVKNGSPAAAIAVPEQYRDLAAGINAAVSQKTGVELPVIADTELARMRGLSTNLIVPGSRDDNAASARLYSFHYALIDGCHPGPQGNELRSVHNPFGDGHNVILAGGSRPEGTRAAVEKLVKAIQQCPAGKDLKLGYLMDITLDPAKKVPAASDQAKIWEGSKGYGERGTFAWNQLSKNLALFYVTGDTKFAKEFLRFAFPTPAVAKELLQKDDEAFWDSMHPLSTPYHYRALQIILYWDLVEEHPFFDGVREKVTAALYEQNAEKSRKKSGVFNQTFMQKQTGDRHRGWEALATWGIARYFYKNYGTKDGEDGMKCAENVLGSARQYMALEAGSFFWFNTFMEPIINYLVLTGAEEVRGLPSMKNYCEALMALCCGAEDWSTNSTAFNMYAKLAYLTDDEAPVTLLRLAVPDPQEFRLGQSWYPAKPYRKNFFKDVQGKVFRPEFAGENMICFREKPQDMKYKDAAQFLSYRKGSDNFLLDTKYEQGRNPFHNHAMIRFTLDGMPLLAGHYNTLQIFCNGISSGEPGFFTDFRNGFGRLDQITFADGTVFNGNSHDWNRVNVLRDRRWMLHVDTVTPTCDMAKSVINVLFQMTSGTNAEIEPDGDLTLSRTESGSVRKLPGVFLAMQGRELLNCVQHSGKYYSAFLNCPGVSGVKAKEPVKIAFELKQPVRGQVTMTFINADSLRGPVNVEVDGKLAAQNFNHVSDAVKEVSLALGTHDFAAGKHEITLIPQSFPGDSGLLTFSSLMIAEPGANVTPARRNAVISVSRTAVPENTAVSASASGKSTAYAYNFTMPGKNGVPFRVVSLIRMGMHGRTASAAQVGNEVALLLPEPALLTFRDGGFFLQSRDFIFGYRVNMPEFSGVKGPSTFEFYPEGGRLVLRKADGSVRENFINLAPPAFPEAKVLAMLKAKPLPEVRQAEYPALRPVWTIPCGGNAFPGALHRFTRQGKAYFIAALGNEVKLCDFAGQVLWKKTLAAPCGALYYWPGADLLLAGTRNELVTAWDWNGKKQWTFISQMSKHLVDSVKFYWFKKALPGVTHLSSAVLDGQDMLIAGSTGTVEVLDKQGKLLAREWGEWGYTSESLQLGNEVRLLRRHGSNPYLMALRMRNGKPVVVHIGMSHDKKGGEMGRFGFSMVGRYGLLAAKLAPGRDLQTVETLNGVHNRLMVRDLNGKIQHEADLGPGFVAQATIYGRDAATRRNVRGLGILPPDDQGNCQIVLAFNRKFAAGFDPELRVQWMTPLPAQPVRLLVIGKDRLAVACADGRVLLLDRQGNILAQARVSGLPAELAADGSVLAVADEHGNLAGFSVKCQEIR